jgi:hypothetical protein
VEPRGVHERDSGEVEHDVLEALRADAAKLLLDGADRRHVHLAARGDDGGLTLRLDLAAERLDVLRQHLPSKLLLKNKHDASKTPCLALLRVCDGGPRSYEGPRPVGRS